MTTTADPATRPTVSLPALNVSDRELQAQDQWVTKRIPSDADPDVRAKAAAQLVASLTKELDSVRGQRDLAAYSVHVHYRVRRGGGIATALGVGRTRWQAIKEKQRELGLAAFDAAPTRLPALARQTVLLTRRYTAALAARDNAVQELIASGWSNARVAAWIGRDAARVSHVRNKTPEAVAS